MIKWRQRIRIWFQREKCKNQASLELLKDRATKCKGVPGMGLCCGCHYRAMECVGCDGWPECTKISHVCHKGH